MAKKPIVAILYDFDKTLCSEDMQNYSFIPALGMTPEEFWGYVGEFSDKTGVEKILSYMYCMVEMSKKKGIHLTREWLENLGKDIKFYNGVTTWFKRINDYGKSQGIHVEHYLVSSGTKEIIDGCAIAKEFKAVYGCEFLFNENSEPIWPKNTINFTAKTQYLFRISKGVLDANDDVKLNRKTQNRRIPYRNIIYLGDGMTDIPIMTLVKENGGKSIAVYARGKKEKVMPLYEENRVNFVCRADYGAGNELEKIMKLIINQISVTEALLKVENRQAENKQ